MSSLVLLISLLTLVHFLKKNISTKVLDLHYSTIVVTTVLVVYTINRSDLANSVHKFSGTALLNLDNPNLLIIKISLVITMVLLLIIMLLNVPKQKLSPLIAMLVLCTLQIVFSIYCRLNEILDMGFVNFFKGSIITLVTALYIGNGYKNGFSYFKRIPKY